VTHTNPELPDRCVVCREPLVTRDETPSTSTGTRQKRTHQDAGKKEKSAKKKNKMSQAAENFWAMPGNYSSSAASEGGSSTLAASQATATEVRMFLELGKTNTPVDS
jgi:hypothetical protein